MPTYAYVVKDKTGRTHRGLLETESRNALIEQLWKQGCVVLSIEERAAGRAAGFRGSQVRVKGEHLVVFSRQLATLVDSGVPLVSALEILVEQSEHRTFGTVVHTLRDDVETGMALSEAMSRHPRIFSELFVSMVKVGESSGQLDEILDRVASYIEKVEALQGKVRASLFYPAFVSLLAFSITAGLVIFIVPQFKEIFTALGGQLPLPTRMLLSVSDLMRQYLVVELLGVMAAAIALRAFLATPHGRRWFDGVTLQVAVLGPLFRKVAIARFASTLATLINAGVPILTALDIVAKTAGNRVVEEAVRSAGVSIKEGENIASPLAKSRVFPPMVTRMIAVGEKSGELEKMLVKIGDFYERQVDTAVTALTSLIEPVVITVLGVVIGGIVIALFLPIFQISTLLSR